MPVQPIRRVKSLYFGWWVVLGAAAGHFASVGFVSVLYGVMLRPMTDELGWTFAQLTGANSAAAITVALTGPLFGPLIDSRGSRPLMLVGAIADGAVLLATSQVNALWQFIALQLLAGVLARPLIGGVVVNVAVSKWFVARRGWAISIASSGFSFGTMLMPIIATTVVGSVGWRDGFVVMAILFWAMMIPAAMLMRSAPEDYGLLPDGHREGDPTTERRAEEIAQSQRDFDGSLNRAEAVRTSAFWRLVIAFSVFVAANIAFLFHGIPFVSGAGFTGGQAGFAFGFTGVSGLISKFAWGWALSRFSARYLSVAAFAFAGGGTLFLLVATAIESMPVLLLAFALWGFGFGGVTPLSEYMWALSFGRRYLGAVRSAAVPAQVLATASGPLLVALAFDATGSYRGAFAGLVAVYVIGALVITGMRSPAAARTPPAIPVSAGDAPGPASSANPRG